MPENSLVSFQVGHMHFAIAAVIDGYTIVVGHIDTNTFDLVNYLYTSSSPHYCNHYQTFDNLYTV